MANNIESNYFFLYLLQTNYFFPFIGKQTIFFQKNQCPLPPKIFKWLLPNMDGRNVIQNPQIFQ